jgi:hypothetical protein
LSSDKCLTVPAGSIVKGTQLVLQPCTGAPEQQFALQSTGEILFQSGFCLDAASGQGKDGDAVIIWPCHGDTNQKWTVTSAGEIRGINDLCVDVRAETAADGQPIACVDLSWPIESAVGHRVLLLHSSATPSADRALPPAQQAQLALAFDPTSSLSTSSRIGPTGTAVGTPSYMAGPGARYALDASEAIDFGSGALDNVWTGTSGWTYIATVQTGAKAQAPHYILVKENTTGQFAFFRNTKGGLELVVYTPQPNYENAQTVADSGFYDGSGSDALQSASTVRSANQAVYQRYSRDRDESYVVRDRWRDCRHERATPYGDRRKGCIPRQPRARRGVCVSRRPYGHRSS